MSAISELDGDVGAAGAGSERMTDAQAEVARIMTICNACRYCEGLCAVFPAMEMRRAFAGGDVDFLANLCHACGACYQDCQYAPPHAFEVNAPLALAEAREESYARYAWPAALAPVFERNGLVIAVLAALSVAAFLIGFAWFSAPGVLFSATVEPGAFYAVMPHNGMVALFGGVFLFALLAMAMSVARYWRSLGPAPASGWPALRTAIGDAARLRNLDGGGAGCAPDETTTRDGRKHAHHMTFYGFLLCFASTSLGTLMHYGFGAIAPYPLWHPVVILGTLGGIGITLGPIFLWREKRRRGAHLGGRSAGGMDVAFLAMLCLTGATGLLLLALRATPAMNLLLAVHLGVVFALFLSFPYGKFVHGLYRFAALVRHAAEQRSAS